MPKIYTQSLRNLAMKVQPSILTGAIDECADYIDELEREVEVNLIADDLLRESIHRLYWKSMIEVIGEQKANDVVDNLSKKS